MKTKLLAGVLSALMLLSLFAGCGKPEDDTPSASTPSSPSVPADPKPEKVPVALFSTLDLDFQEDIPLDITVTYDEASLTCEGTYSDGSYFLEIMSYKGKLLRQYIKLPNGDWNQSTFTYDEKGNNIIYTGSSSTDPTVTTTMTYDDKGNMLTSIATDGETRQESTYTYDDQGNLLSEHFSDTAGTDLSTVFTYDAKGNMLSETISEGGEITQTTLWTYDENGNMLTKVLTSGELTEETTYTWDAGYIATESFSDNGGFQFYRVYSHDARGNVLTETYFDSDDYNYTSRCIYNENDDLLSLQYISNRSFYREAYTYDEKGNITFQSYEDSDGFHSQTTYTYDEKGNLLERAYTDSDDTAAKAVYTYDEHGSLLAYRLSDQAGDTIESSAYTYTYVQMDPDAAEARKELMQQLFGEMIR